MPPEPFSRSCSSFHYAKVFRKAGIAWGKGDIHKAIAILAAALALAQEQGDAEVAQVLQQDIARYQRLINGTQMAPSPAIPWAPDRGVFIVFEGLDGAGKTTQVKLLCDRLQQAGYEVVSLKEPTDGAWGQKIRQMARAGRHDVAPETELTWFLEDRRQDVQQNIRPALARGQIVVLDRYYFSTMAYQGARGFDPADIQQCNEAFAPPPDLLFLLEIPPERGLARLQQARSPDHFEQLDYLQRVAHLFARMDFAYLRRIPATLAIETVHDRIWHKVQTVLPQVSRNRGCR